MCAQEARRIARFQKELDEMYDKLPENVQIKEPTEREKQEKKLYLYVVFPGPVCAFVS